MLVLTRAQVASLLDLDALIDALARAMSDLSAGRASSPARVGTGPETGRLLGAMLGYAPSPEVLMTKLVSLFPGNAGTDLPIHQAVIVAFDPKTGSPSALLDGTEITAVRTGACSALSARLLAREDATVLAIVGTGVQARSHARAMCRVRPIAEIRVVGRTRAKADALAGELSAELGVSTRGYDTCAEAFAGADIVCATTHSDAPVVRREWLTPGTHVTSVGYGGREVDDATIADALVCVETRDAALGPFPAGTEDLLQPIRDGIITADHIHAELGELVAGSRPGRTAAEQITLYKAVGVAVQDAAATALVLAAAVAEDTGRHIDI